ncbi:MAG: hypothetical protein ACN6O7_00655 [Sphingobacterium sp.]
MIYSANKKELLDYLLMLGLIGANTYTMMLHREINNDVVCKGNVELENEIINLEVKIEPEVNAYKVIGFRAELVRIPALEHTVSQGMDTAMLEQRISEVNWKQVSKEELLEDKISSIITDVQFLQLNGSGHAQEVMEMLMLKYWEAAPVSEVAVFPNRGNYITSVVMDLNGDLNDLDILRINNLLRGRSLVQFDFSNTDLFARNYIIKLENGLLTRYPDFNVSSCLQQLPFAGLPPNDILKRLLCGQREAVELILEGTAKSAFIEMDGRQSRIAIYDTDGQEVDLTSINKPKQQSQEPLNKKDRGRKKGL